MDELDLLGKLISLPHLMLVTEEQILQGRVPGTDVTVVIRPLVLGGICSPGRDILILSASSWYSGPLVFLCGVVGVVIEFLGLGPVGILDSLLRLFANDEAVHLVGDIRENGGIAVDRHFGDLSAVYVASVTGQ